MEAPHARRTGWYRFAAPAAIALILAIVFGYTLAARAPWLAATRQDPFQAIEAADLGFVRACLEKGALGECAALLERPSDVPVGKLAQSLPLPWAPAADRLGQALAPLAVVNAIGRAAAFKTSALLGGLPVALAAQLAAALCLAWWVFANTQRAGFNRGAAALFSLTPGLALLLLPGVLVGSATPLMLISAELALFALIVALEAAYFAHNKRRCAFVVLLVQAVVCAIGASLDPVLLLLTLVLLVVRLCESPSRRSLLGVVLQALIVGVSTAALFFAGRRAGLVPEAIAGDGVDPWARAIPAGLGESARALWIGSLAGLAASVGSLFARRMRRNRAYRQLVSAMAVATLPVLGRALLVAPASHAGEASALFYAIPLAAVPFALLPAAVAVGLGPWAAKASLGRFGASMNGREWSVRLPVIPCVALALGLVWVVDAHRGFRGRFPEPTRYAKLCRKVRHAPPRGQGPLANPLESYAEGLQLTGEVALVDYRLEHIAGNRFRFRLVFHVSKLLAGDYMIGASAFVADADRSALPWDRAGTTHDAWDFQPDPPTSAWQPGDYILVETEVAAKPVAYTVLLGLYDRCFENGWRKHLYGNELRLQIANPHCPSEVAFLRNPGFEEWAGGRPSAWEIAAGAAVPGLVASVEAREGALAVAVPATETPMDLVQHVQTYVPIAGRGVVFTVKARCAKPATVYLGVSFAGRVFWGTPHPGDGEWHTVQIYCGAPHTFREETFDVIVRTAGGPSEACLIDGAALDVL